MISSNLATFADAQLVVVVESARENLVLLCLRQGVVGACPHVGKDDTSIFGMNHLRYQDKLETPTTTPGGEALSNTP